jgi:ATP-dependent DNA helicase RecQ
VDATSVLGRKVAVEATHELPAADIYVLPSLRLVDLSFAGRTHVSQQSLAAIRDAKVGDPLTLALQEGKWVLVDAGGLLLGRMANAWQPPQGHVFDKGQVGAIVNWRKVDNKEEFHGTLSRDSWETVLPELIFRPQRGEGRNGLPVSEPKAREPKTQPVDSNAAVAKSTEGAVSDAIQDDLTLVETIVRDALSEATGWEALVAVLEAKGIALGPRGGGLVVMEAKSRVDICKLSAIGIRYINVIKKFGEGFPGHPATSLVERALSEQNTATAQAKPRKGRRNRRTRRGGDDITLVED